MSALDETKDSDCAPGKSYKLFDCSVSDFSVLVTTTAFVDKTLMIRDIFSSSSRILVTAPPRFGKSTIIDMIKRFVEIEVDATGTPKPVHTTDNYKLFQDYNLEIFNDKTLFNEHFGKYPVIHIDFEPLAEAVNFGHMLDIFRTVVQKTFNQHRYLLDIPSFKIDATYFEENVIKNIGESVLKYSFEYLSSVLYKYFRKNVYVLIDCYDSYVNSILFNSNDSDTGNFIKATINNILKNSQCVYQIVMTGVLPLTGIGSPLHRNNVNCYSFLDGHCFCKYYVLTSDELEEVLKKLITGSEERSETKRVISDYYNGYMIQNQTVQVYSIWSVLQYVQRREMQSSWYSHEYIERFKSVFIISQIRDKTEQLILGNELRLDISRPLSATDILQLNAKRDCDEAEDFTSNIVDTFFILLYHFGYLSVNKVWGRGVVYVKIPNEEIKYELTKVLFDVNQSLYYNNLNDADNLRYWVDSVQPNETALANTITKLWDVLSVWSGVTLLTNDEFMTRLFLMLLTKPDYTKTVFRRVGWQNRDTIIFKNKHEVAICITVEGATPSVRFKNRENLKSCCVGRRDLSRCSYRAHQQLSQYTDVQKLFSEYGNARGKLIIGISYGFFRYDENICYGLYITYSYEFTEGNSLQDIKSLDNFFVKEPLPKQSLAS